MKHISPKELFILLIIVLVFIASSFFAKGNDTTSVLEIQGKVLGIKTTVSNSYYVALICKDSVIDFKIIKGNNMFKFNPKNKGLYTVRIMKNGHQPKVISVDTKLAAYQNGYYRYYFETELIEDEAALKLKINPVAPKIALTSFDPKKRWFNYNSIYVRKPKTIFYAGRHK